jgi:phosphohistidine phosphatase
MKRLVIVRHAKAVPYGYDRDFSRDLTERGVEDAGMISQHLKELGILPGMMVSSPANRALQTALIFAGNLGFPEMEVRHESQMYMEFTTAEFLDFVQGFPDEVSTVFVFGHNPGVSYFAERLAKDFYAEMPTCSTVGIDFGVDKWVEVEGRSGTTAFHIYPKSLRR